MQNSLTLSSPGSSPKLSTIDACLEKIGPRNRYQILVYIIFFWQFLFSTIFFASGSFTFLDPIFICEDGQECKQSKACSEQHYTISPKSSKSVTFEFHLYCNRQSLKSLAESFVFIGSAVGTFLFSFISDQFGRKLAQILAWGTATLGAVIYGSAQNVTMIIIGIFLGGMGSYPSNTLSFIIFTESSCGNFRSIMTGLILLGYSVSIFLIDLVQYVDGNDWRTLILYWTMIPMVILNIPNFFLVESPRFYVNKNNNKILESFNKIATINRRPLLTYEQIDFDQINDSSKKSKHIYNYVDLFKFKSLRFSAIFAALLKFMNMFVLYTISYSLPLIGFSIYINSIFQGFSDTVSMLLTGIALKQFKRKQTLIVSGGILYFFCLSFLFFNIPQSCKNEICWQKIMQIVAFTIGRGGSTYFFAIISVYYPELFPTCIRASGVGWTRAIGVGGSVLSPYAIQFCQNINFNPFIFAGCVGILSYGNLFFLGETYGKPLEDEIKELRKNNPHQQISNEDSGVQQNLLEKEKEKLIN